MGGRGCRFFEVLLLQTDSVGFSFIQFFKAWYRLASIRGDLSPVDLT